MRKRTVPAPKRRPRLSDKIVFAPQALKSLVAGFDGLASVLALTLGPSNGPIFNSREDGSVEILSDAGMIARRVVEIPGRCQNAGAMILRNLAWRMHEHYGDGAATASVLARAIVRESFKLIEAGIDPVLIRGGLEHGLAVALATLDCLSTPVVGNEQLVSIATTLCGEPELGSILAEIVDILGPSASVLFEEFPVPFLDRDYVEGAHWRA